MPCSRFALVAIALGIGCAGCTDETTDARRDPVFFSGVESVSLGYETRPALVSEDGTVKSVDATVPRGAPSLRFAIATTEPAGDVGFRLSVDGQTVFEKILAVSEAEHWWDQRPIDLAAWAGETVEIVFETEGDGLWGHPRIVTEPPEGPRIVVVSIDCLRADHVGVYGYDEPTTPSIDAFAEDGVLFEHAVSASSWTIPSHMSMFTGLPPMVHGVNDSPDNFWAGRAKTLAPTVPYVAEILAREGYETGAVVSSAPMSPLYGFERGFGIYRVHAAKAEEVVDSALDLVTRAGERPFFLFVHFIDPHWPYMPMVEFTSYAKEFIERFGDRPRDISELIERHRGKALKALPEDADDVQTLYDAAVAYVDRELGRFFAELKAGGLYDEALILVTGDHGEAFYDHETFGHAKTLYQELTHVPLIVKWPESSQDVPRGRVSRPVSHVDVFPTVLRAAGVASPSSTPMAGADLKTAPAERAIVLDASWEDQWRRETMISVRRGDWKYIAVVPFAPFDELSLDAPVREELYHLAEDPGETKNLIDDPPTDLAPFRERVRAYVHAARVFRARHEGGAVEIDDDVRRRLEALGYVTPGSPTSPTSR